MDTVVIKFQGFDEKSTTKVLGCPLHSIFLNLAVELRKIEKIPLYATLRRGEPLSILAGPAAQLDPCRINSFKKSFSAKARKWAADTYTCQIRVGSLETGPRQNALGGSHS